jgi:MFS family permease
MGTLLLSAFSYTLSTKGTILEYDLIVQALGTDHYRNQWLTGPAAVLGLVGLFMPLYYMRVFGARRIYIVGAVCLAVGCLGAAVVRIPWHAGIFAAIRSGTGLVAIPGFTLFGRLMPTRRGLSTSIYLAVVYGGQVMAEPLGALLAFAPSWRVLFVILAGISLWLIVVAVVLFPDDRPATRPDKPFDALGATLLAMWVALVLFLLYRGNYLGWTVSTPIRLAAVGLVVVTGLFIWRQLTAAEPFVNLSAFGYPTVAVTMVCAALWSAALYGGAVQFSDYLLLRGYERWKAGRVMLPPALAIMTSMLLGAFIVRRPAYVWALRIGLAGMTVVGFQLAAADYYSSWQWLMAVSTLWGAFAGLCLPGIGRLVFEGQEPEAAASTGAIKFFMRGFGGTAGVLLAGVLLDRAAAWGLDFVRTSIVLGQGSLEAIEPGIQDHMTRRGSTEPEAAAQTTALIGSWVELHARIIGYRAVLRACALASGLALFIAFFIRTEKEFSVFDADEEFVPALVRRCLGGVRAGGGQEPTG